MRTSRQCPRLGLQRRGDHRAGGTQVLPAKEGVADRFRIDVAGQVDRAYLDGELALRDTANLVRVRARQELQHGIGRLIRRDGGDPALERQLLLGGHVVAAAEPKRDCLADEGRRVDERRVRSDVVWWGWHAVDF